MSNALKNAFIFLGGMASGVAASYLVATYVIGIEWVVVDGDEEAEQASEVSEVKADDKGTPIEPKPEPATKQDALTGYTNIEDNPSFVDYTGKIAKPVHVEEEELEAPPKVEIFGDPTAQPYMCDSLEYGADVEYDEIELYFYEKDALVTDCWNYPVEDIEGTIGNAAYLELCNGGDPDVIYVKNDRLKSYYEITKQIEDYPGISG